MTLLVNDLYDNIIRVNAGVLLFLGTFIGIVTRQDIIRYFVNK